MFTVQQREQFPARHFLIIMVVLKSSALPHVLTTAMGVSRRVLPAIGVSRIMLNAIGVSRIMLNAIGVSRRMLLQ